MATSTTYTGTDSKYCLSSWAATASLMAARHDEAVKMALGLAFRRIQATSLLVSAGDASVAVSPAASVPRTIVAKGRQLGSCTRTTGATCGLSQVDVEGRVIVLSGSRPCSCCSPAPNFTASSLRRDLVKDLS